MVFVGELCEEKRLNDFDMKTLMKHYDRFIALMTDGMLYVNPTISFHIACLLLGADERALGRLVEDETGFTGDELIVSYRQSYYDFLLKNFGIRL